MPSRIGRGSWVAVLLALAGCGSGSSPAADTSVDAGARGGQDGTDASTPGDDADGTSDGASSDDAGSADSSTPVIDAGDAGASPDAGTVWRPSPSAPIHFHWMIGASKFTSADILSGQSGAVVYDIDGENATAADVAAIHAAGAIAVCYVDVGSREQGRSDYANFPPAVVGPAVQGWPGENWLLVTAANRDAVLGIMKKRFVDWCQKKGFDAIEPDNLDAWGNIAGVSKADNVAYDLAIAGLAHSLSISIGLKNVVPSLGASDLPAFVAAFDWALDEQCYEYSECSGYWAAGSFLPAGKAVFDVEYDATPDCTESKQHHMNAQKTDLDLVGATDQGYAYTPCVPDSQATW